MKKKQKIRNRRCRAAIQLLFFLMAPAVFSTAFAGVKYLFTQMGQSAQLELVSFVKTLLAVCVFTILFGRYFCGYACAFGSLGDFMHAVSQAVQKKCGKKLPRIPEKWITKAMYIKYGILLFLLLSCLSGFYGKMQGSSPWDVFSALTALRLPPAGYAVGSGLLALILIGMCIEERFFCKFLCPMGAVFALLPVLPFSALRRNREQCIPKCSACRKQCPVRLEIEEDGARNGECLQCGKCIDVCPRGNIDDGIPAKGSRLWKIFLKAGVLLAVIYITGN